MERAGHPPTPAPSGSDSRGERVSAAGWEGVGSEPRTQAFPHSEKSCEGRPGYEASRQLVGNGHRAV